MNLGKNVFNLLKRQDRAVIVGLGSFRRNHTPATYDEDKNVYLPPITYIDYDRSEDEGYDFVQYIQQLESIGRSEALKIVADAVQDIKHKIDEDGQVKLDDLGYLLSYGDSYVFKPLDLSGFNYEPVYAPELLVKKTESAPEPLVDKEEVVPSVATSVEQASGEVTAETQQEDVVDGLNVAEVNTVNALSEADNLDFAEPEEPKRSNAIWYVILVVVALGILATLLLMDDGKLMDDGDKTTIVSNMPEMVEDSTVEVVDTSLTLVNPTDSLALGDSLSTTVQVVDTLESVENVPLVPADHHWQIVIGSHKTLAQAYEQAESYNKAGFAKVRVIPSNLAKNRKKVIWDSYKTKAEADSALVYVQKHIIKDAWPDRIK